MLKKPKAPPRKAPRQARSASTVDAILTATGQLLLKTGYDRMTTNAVAQVAGVSIGTLYQYFPDKAALAAGLFDRDIREKLVALQGAVDRFHGAPLEDLVRAMVWGLARRNPVGDPLRRALIALQVRFAAMGQLEDAATPFLQLVGDVLVARRAEIRTQDPELLAYMVVHTMEALLHALVLQPPGSRSMEDVVEELTRMMMGYLLPTAAVARPRAAAAAAG